LYDPIYTCDYRKYFKLLASLLVFPRLIFTQSLLTEVKVRKHFLELDALRGVAAVAVVVLHFSTDVQGKPLVIRAGLAVDFFFLLSGFVVNHAYEARLCSGTMTTLEFIRVRLIRLMPLVVIAAIVSAVYYLVVEQVAVKSLLWALLGAITTIPIPVGTIPNTAHWPLNPPEWSLFFELIASFVFVVALTGRSTRTLALFATFSFGFLLLSVYLDGTAFTLRLWCCLARVLFFFTTGMIVNRLFALQRLPELRLPFVVAASILIVSFTFTWGGWISEIITAAVIFPLIIASAAHSQSGTRASQAAKFLGDVSYPLYIMHWPALLLVRHSISRDLTEGPSAIVAFTVLAATFAWTTSRFLETPIRQYLSSSWRFPRKLKLPDSSS
jgi:peptidoglycan/LPS O-acetylase OafA/YrhL